MMSEVGPGYMRLYPLPTDGKVHRTVELVENVVLVDLDERGHVLGIERIDGPVQIGDLAAAISCMTWLPKARVA